MTTYTLTVRVAEGAEPDIEEHLHDVAAHLVKARVAWTLTQRHDAWTLTQQHDAGFERPVARVPRLALVGE